MKLVRAFMVLAAVTSLTACPGKKGKGDKIAVPPQGQEACVYNGTNYQYNNGYNYGYYGYNNNYTNCQNANQYVNNANYPYFQPYNYSGYNYTNNYYYGGNCDVGYVDLYIIGLYTYYCVNQGYANNYGWNSWCQPCQVGSDPRCYPQTQWNYGGPSTLGCYY